MLQLNWDMFGRGFDLHFLVKEHPDYWDLFTFSFYSTLDFENSRDYAFQLCLLGYTIFWFCISAKA